MVNKLYTPVNWKNYPSKDTPMTATNLNKMDSGIDDLDDRLVSVANSQETMESDIDDIEEDISTLNENLQTLSEAVEGEIVDTITFPFTATKNGIYHVTLKGNSGKYIRVREDGTEYHVFVLTGSGQGYGTNCVIKKGCTYSIEGDATILMDRILYLG